MKTLFTTLIAVGALAFGSTANAATISYVLDQSNDLTDGVTYAVVTIADEIALDGDGNPIVVGGVAELTGNISFTVDVVDSAFNIVDATNFGLQAFSFNYDMNVLGTGPDFDVLGASGLAITGIDPIDWTVTNTNGSISEFGKFDFDLAGDGSSRANPLSFLITGVDGDTIDNYSVLFAAHIAGFDLTDCDSGVGVDGCTSAWFAGNGHTDRGLTPPEVPIPAAVWLFGSGLLGLVAVGRRKV